LVATEVTPDERCAIALDVGGTSVRAGAVGPNGELVAGSRRAVPIDSGGTRDSIVEGFGEALAGALARAERAGLRVLGIAVAICGPFDYRRGISLIRGVGKYDALYGVDLGAALRERLGLAEGLPLLFDIDAWSFARGEAWLGVACGYRRAIAFTLGTGVGSAFLDEGRVVTSGPGVPPLGWITGQRYREGILDNYVSRAYIIERYRSALAAAGGDSAHDPGPLPHPGAPLDVESIARRASSGDERALRAFDEVAGRLGRFIRDRHVIPFEAECLVFGGRIARSLDLFRPALERSLTGIPSLKTVLASNDSEASALRGAAKLLFDEAKG
jgi:glucokinase